MCACGNVGEERRGYWRKHLRDTAGENNYWKAIIDAAMPAAATASVATAVSTGRRGLAFTRYSFTSTLFVNEPIMLLPPPPVTPKLLQSHCTTTAQGTTLSPTLLLYALHHTQLVMAISCKGQAVVGVSLGHIA